MSETFELSVLDATFVVSRFEASAAIPAWALEGPGFVSVSRTDDELSIICAADRVPVVAAGAPAWRGLKVHGPLSFETVGVMSALTHALATANISMLAVATHDTDYLFVRIADLARAVRALRHQGHVVHTSA